MFTVYVHRNRITGKPYVGFTSRPERERWWEHVGDARSNRGMCRKFHAAIRKHGTDCWDTEIVFRSEDRAEALRCETETIIELDAIKGGYNITLGGEIGTLGLRRSAETCRKISERQLGALNHRYGVKPTDEQREAHSERMTRWHAANRHPNAGATFSAETRAKMSEAHAGERNAFFGRQHTEETKRGLSENNPCRGLWGWMNPCTQANPEAMAIYARAAEYHAWWIEDGRGADAMANAFGEARRKPHCTLVERFKAGWSPLDDSAWLAHFKRETCA